MQIEGIGKAKSVIDKKDNKEISGSFSDIKIAGKKNLNFASNDNSVEDKKKDNPKEHTDKKEERKEKKEEPHIENEDDKEKDSEEIGVRADNNYSDFYEYVGNQVAHLDLLRKNDSTLAQGLTGFRYSDGMYVSRILLSNAGAKSIYLKQYHDARRNVRITGFKIDEKTKKTLKEARRKAYGRGFIDRRIKQGTLLVSSKAFNSEDAAESDIRLRAFVSSTQRASHTFSITKDAIRTHHKTSLIGIVESKILTKSTGIIKKAYGNSSIGRKTAILKKDVRSMFYTAKETVGFTAKETIKKSSGFIKENIPHVFSGSSKQSGLFGIGDFFERSLIGQMVDFSKGFYYAGKGPTKEAKASKERSKNKRARDLGEKAGRGAVKVQNAKWRVSDVVRTPSRALGKMVEGIKKINLRAIGILGAVAFALFKYYNVLLAIVMILLSIDDVLVKSAHAAEEMSNAYIEMLSHVINYEDYDDMRADINFLLAKDNARNEHINDIGEGEPINNEVTNNHTIDSYGSPQEEGFYVHLLDPYGNELPEGCSNIRDIEALCIAMISNDLGMYKGYTRDKWMLDVLLSDMYDLLAGAVEYEESDIYRCYYGCEDFYYHCNKASDYNDYYYIYANGGYCFTELLPIRASDDGCLLRDSHGNIYSNPYGPDDEDAVHYSGYTYFCDGRHRARVCYGHKNLDVNVTLYGLEYAISHNIYPSNWESKSYAPMIREFIEKGAWTNPKYAQYARNYYAGDWEELYGISLNGGVGYSRVNPLSDEEVEKIMESLPEDISQNRREVIKLSLEAVGRIGYQWGGKAIGSGFFATFGSQTPDEKGRVNGLDCSGFVQWVYRSAISKALPASTASYGGYALEDYQDLKVGDIGFYKAPGDSDNHMGIYIGKDEAGIDTWVHCAGGSGVTFGSGNFRYYIRVIN